MDINQYFSSSIIPKQDDMYFVQFPSFSGYVELVIDRHNATQVACGENELFPHLNTEGLIHDIHKVILASQLLGYIALRIIDTGDIYSEKLFLIRYGEIFSCMLMGQVYTVFIFTDIYGGEHVYTDIPSDGLFEWSYRENIFSIVNRLTGIIVFEHTCPLLVQKSRTNIKNIAPHTSQTLLYIPDPLFPDSSKMLGEFFDLVSDIVSYEKVDESFRIDARRINSRDFRKLVGFLGIYSCVLPDEENIHGFLNLTDVIDGQFELPAEFGTIKSIDFIDPRWERFRLGLLEISYILIEMEQSRNATKGGIQAIDTLGNPHTLLQRKRLETQDQAFDEVTPRYLQMREQLISLLRYHIS